MGRLRHPTYLVLLLLLAWAVGRGTLDVPAPPPDALPEGVYQVRRVVDGDTLLLANGARLRLIGVDTPESVHPKRPPEPLGKEAAAFTRQWVEGRDVDVRFDRERQDRYGRWLAYVYVGGRLLNEEIIHAGFSAAETRFRYDPAMARRFRAAEEDARRHQRGIWSLRRTRSQSRPQRTHGLGGDTARPTILDPLRQQWAQDILTLHPAVGLR